MPGRASRAALSAEFSSTRSHFQPSWEYVRVGLPVNRLLHVLHLTGPLIRITGLIVAAVAVQMVLSGTGEWLALMGPTR